jgi:hypothetical protein
LGLTDEEQVSINSMTSRFSQETNLECEKKYGGMTRYSPGSDQSGQRRFEADLQANMVTPIDIATIAVTALPSPFPKSAEQVAAEGQAARAAQRTEQNRVTQLAMEGVMARSVVCQQEVKGLRLTLMADYMQRNLDAAQGLSAKDRADFETEAATDGVPGSLTRRVSPRRRSVVRPAQHGAPDARTTVSATACAASAGRLASTLRCRRDTRARSCSPS